MYHCNPLAGERYYLQLLLTVVKGLQSFEHLCTVNGIIYKTFCGAYMALGLTYNNSKRIETFKKAVIFTNEEALQRLLVTVLVHGDLADALTI